MAKRGHNARKGKKGFQKTGVKTPAVPPASMQYGVVESSSVEPPNYLSKKDTQAYFAPNGDTVCLMGVLSDSDASELRAIAESEQAGGKLADEMKSWEDGKFFVDSDGVGGLGLARGYQLNFVPNGALNLAKNNTFHSYPEPFSSTTKGIEIWDMKDSKLVGFLTSEDSGNLVKMANQTIMLMHKRGLFN